MKKNVQNKTLWANFETKSGKAGRDKKFYRTTFYFFQRCPAIRPGRNSSFFLYFWGELFKTTDT